MIIPAGCVQTAIEPVAWMVAAVEKGYLRRREPLVKGVIFAAPGVFPDAAESAHDAAVTYSDTRV